MAPNRSEDTLFARALTDGTDEALAAWIASGPESVNRLRSELTGERMVAAPDGMSPRELIDNLQASSHAVASAYPEEFLGAFADRVWDKNTFVCTGLGAINRPGVTRRLMRLLQSDDQWVRVHTAVALRGHRHRGLRSVLIAALEDPDDLVRYHVEQRLAEMDETSDEN